MSDHPRSTTLITSKRKTDSTLDVSALLQLISYGFMILAILFLVLLGVRLFQRVTQKKQASEHLRSTVGYLENKLAGCDDPSAIQVAEDPAYGSVLVLPLSGGKYAVKIYLYEGNLVEELSRYTLGSSSTAEDGTPESTGDPTSDETLTLTEAAVNVDPSLAEVISPADSFTAELIPGQEVRLTVEGQPIVFSVRRAGDAQ